MRFYVAITDLCVEVRRRACFNPYRLLVVLLTCYLISMED